MGDAGIAHANRLRPDTSVAVGTALADCPPHRSRRALLAQWTGQIAFDFIADDRERLWAIDCNPGITSGLHLLAHQPGLVAAFLGQATEDIDAECRRLGGVAGGPDGLLGGGALRGPGS